MSGSPALPRPILIFISSAQEEFEAFRQDLKQLIDHEEIGGQFITKAVLIENERGTVIQSEIRQALDEASIYVGVFGEKLRDWVKAEFEYAKSRGLPQLIYKYKKAKGRGRPKPKPRGRKSKVDQYLEEQAKRSGIRINGPYRKTDPLLDLIPVDIANTIMKMVRENADIRRRINESIPVT